MADNAALETLGVTEPDRLRDQLKRAAATNSLSEEDLAAASPAPTWRDCAGSVLSSYGQAEKASVPAASPPSFPSDQTEGSRSGEIWRIRVSDNKGWADDRIVRLNGQPDHPAIILDRRFYRRAKGGDPCDHVFARLAG